MDLIHNNISRYVQEECATGCTGIYIAAMRMMENNACLFYSLLNWVL